MANLEIRRLVLRLIGRRGVGRPPLAGAVGEGGGANTGGERAFASKQTRGTAVLCGVGELMAPARRAVILAGGLGTRLRPLTDAIPKPLLPIGEKSLLEIQIHRLKQFGFAQVFLATNYKSEYIESFFGDGQRLGVEVRVSKEDKPLGTCGPLSLLRHELTAPFLVMNGDILTTMDFGALFEFAVASPADLVVTTKKMVMPFAFGNVESDGDFVTGVLEKPDLTIEVIAGIYVMKPAVLRRVPDDTYFGMDDLIKLMLEDRDPVGRFLTRDLWLDVGQLPDYEKAQRVYRTHFEPRP